MYNSQAFFSQPQIKIYIEHARENHFVHASTNQHYRLITFNIFIYKEIHLTFKLKLSLLTQLGQFLLHINKTYFTLKLQNYPKDIRVSNAYRDISKLSRLFRGFPLAAIYIYIYIYTN